MRFITIFRLVTAAIFATTILSLPLAVSAACTNDKSSALKTDAYNGLCQVGGGGINVENIFSTVVSILSIIIGGVAIIVIVISGFRFLVSGGDSNKVAAAKNSLIYALVGIAVAALAQFFVHVVLNRASNL